ncbi:redoxin domain-containing protein [Rhodococcus antarcticus]|uniref:Redoxin domain-containing protein n=1 Tax=Rhodococcus antarcticus TaxID=2987751 RepID=A0ABY6NZI7_9NOCA|nr:MauE/DoxX family redox-associated membrane protein [Rhodococcus antarcticus]UZJ24802.1 redoxin domain-containing protein [Rhodococcus antarcticus]
MTLLVLVARLVLAAVFVTSGVAKLRDQAGSRTAVADFGVPAALVPLVTVALPVVELLAAVLLLAADPAALIGAVLVLLMLAAFTTAIVANLARGRHPECHCFGQVNSGPTGWSSVARNLALAVVAVVVLLPGAGRPPWVGAVVAGYRGDQLVLGLLVAALALAVVVLGVLLQALTTRYGRVLLRLDAVEDALADDGTPRTAPGFELPDLEGRPVSLEGVVDDGTSTLVVFISPGCAHCGELMPDLARWQSADGPVRTLVVSEGTAEANQSKAVGSPGLQILLQAEREVTEAYGIKGTPGAVLVGPDGSLVGPAVYGVDAIRQNHDFVLAELTGDGTGHGHGHGHGDGLLQIEPRPVRVGDTVPLTALRDESGDGDGPVGAEDDAVLVFWESTCGFCLQIAGDLAAHGEDGPLVLVSASDAAAVRGVGIVAPIARDPGGEVGAAVQVPGTPTAVRVRAGVVSEPPAVGGPAVIALLNRVAVAVG